MSRMLNRQAVQDWLSGQKAAAERLECERARFLISLTPERSLQIYLELARVYTSSLPKAPSPLILAMRQILSRLEEGAKRR